MLRFLQNYPHFLEVVYAVFEKLLLPFKPWLKPNSAVEPLIIWFEEVGKGAVFDCRMCGQCILHSTGMTCPMTCPKNLRNGPCGGVRDNGHCEVKPEMVCVWVNANRRSRQMPDWGHEMVTVQPPVNKRLKDTASWINMLHGIDQEMPPGWEQTPNKPIISEPIEKEMRNLWTMNS